MRVIRSWSGNPALRDAEQTAVRPAPVRRRRLGATGLEVSEIGFGAWGIGGTRDYGVGYGPTDDHESRRALQRACEL